MPRRQIFFTDIIIEAAIPMLVIGLIWSVVVFAISIKGVFYPGQEGTLRYVFFLYVLATVMINRIAGYYGESAKAAGYSILLVGVMALFALVFTSRFGSILGGHDAGEGYLINLALVAIIGFASYKIARESCLDLKDTEDEGESSIQLRARVRAQRDWYRREELAEEDELKRLEEEKKQADAEHEPEPGPARLPKKHPGVWIIYFSLFSMAVFAAGQRLLPQEDWELYRYTFTCLAANLMCALALLLLIGLSSIRRQCWEKKTLVQPNVGWFWILAGASLILFVVSLATLPPRPVPEYYGQTVSEDGLYGPYDAGDEGMKSRPFTIYGMQRKIIAMRIEKAERDKAKLPEKHEELWEDQKEAAEKASGEGRKEDEKAEGAGGAETDEEQQQQQSGSASGTQQATSSGKGGSSKGSQQAKSQASVSQRAQPARPPLPTPPLQGLQTLGRIIVLVLFALAALLAFVMLLGAVIKMSPLRRLSMGFKKFRERFRKLLATAKMPRLSGKKLRNALEEQGLYMENPFRNRALLMQMSKEDLVSYTYKAFENYSHAQGHTPSKDQTPNEFLRSLPDDFREAEFSNIVSLFMLAEYSSHEISDKNIKHLKQAWKKIEA